MSTRQRPFAAGRILSGVLVLALSGCSLIPAYDSPEFSFADSYGDGADGAPRLLDNASWWETFNDATLNRLVDRALEGSIDLDLARERLREARAAVGAVDTNASLNGSGRAERVGGSERDDRTDSSVAFDFSWLLDPYRQREARIEAASARAQVAEAEINAARLFLLSEVATAYVDLRFQQRALALRRKQLRSRDETVDIIRAFVQQGESARLDVVRAEALVAETQALIPVIGANIRAQRNRLRVLMGEAPAPVRQPPLAGAGAGQPRPGMSPDIGIPADLLRNRPDLHIKERRYYAAVAEIGAARAELYPRLFLNGTLALDTVSGDSALNYVFGPAVRLPALPTGPRAAAVSVRLSQARQAHTEWRLNVLQALQEVEDALAQFASSRKAVRAARRAVDAYNEAVVLTKRLLANGGSTVRDLLDAEERVAEAEITHARNLRDLGRSFVALNVALGSGNAVARR